MSYYYLELDEPEHVSYDGSDVLRRTQENISNLAPPGPVKMFETSSMVLLHPSAVASY